MRKVRFEGSEGECNADVVAEVCGRGEDLLGGLRQKGGARRSENEDGPSGVKTRMDPSEF